MRDRLRLQGTRVIQRTEQLRMLLDNSFARLLDPSRLAREQFGGSEGMADMCDTLSVSSSHDVPAEDISNVEDEANEGLLVPVTVMIEGQEERHQKERVREEAQARDAQDE